MTGILLTVVRHCFSCRERVIFCIGEMGMLGCILIKLFDIMNVCNILWLSPINILPCFLLRTVSGVRKGGRGLMCTMPLVRRVGGFVFLIL